MSPSPVKERALQLGLPVTDDLGVLRTMEIPEEAVGVVVAYGRIVPADILERVVMLNVHFSLLPRWRGAAPVERAVLAGDTVTGVCIMRMEEGLDTGPVFARAETAIDDTDTAVVLTERLAAMGARLMCEVLSAPLGTPDPQSGQETYARKISSDEGEIDWTQDAEQILRMVRALPARTSLQGRRLRVVRAEAAHGVLSAGSMDHEGHVGTGNGCVRLVVVQPEGRQAMQAADWIRGLKTGFPVLLGQVP